MGITMPLSKGYARPVSWQGEPFEYVRLIDRGSLTNLFNYLSSKQLRVYLTKSSRPQIEVLAQAQSLERFEDVARDLISASNNQVETSYGGYNFTVNLKSRPQRFWRTNPPSRDEKLIDPEISERFGVLYRPKGLWKLTPLSPSSIDLVLTTSDIKTALF